MLMSLNFVVGLMFLISQAECKFEYKQLRFNTNSTVPCPGGTKDCPSYFTCCQMSQGKFGCCPLPDGVCCSDNLHCCPTGFTCDPSGHSCNRLPVLDLEERHAEPVNVTKVTCPGGDQTCADGYTCCEMRAKGQFSCCPMRNAVCCEDKIHCCPKDEVCDLESGSCQKAPSGKDASPILRIHEVTFSNVSSVICPDGEYQCPDHTTCCPMSDVGQYGCCPMENAVCCEDKMHCCPHGYTCSGQGACVLGNATEVLEREAIQFTDL